MTTGREVDAPAELALVLPVESIGLLGTGPEGSHALTQFGVVSLHLGEDLADLHERLTASGDDDRRALAEAIAAVGAEAAAWVSIRGSDPAGRPVLVMLGRSWSLAVCLHGRVAEWAHGDADLPARVLRASADPGARMLMFARGVARAGVELRDGQVDIAAKDPLLLTRATEAARDGLLPLWRSLRDGVVHAEAG